MKYGAFFDELDLTASDEELCSMEVISNLISCLFQVHSEHWLFTNYSHISETKET
jgi:hypothetical protein